MAATGFTPIQLFYSTTVSQAPSAGSLVNGELAINITDGRLYYKDNLGAVQILATKAAAQTTFQTSLGGLTPSTATSGAVTLAGTLNTTSGGTGLTSWTAGDLPYYATGTTLSKLGIGTNGQILTSTGTAPQWSTLSGVAVTTFSAGTTGFTPSSATSGAITLAGTLATTNGGTGLTSFTANGVVYASSSSALTTGSALTFDGQYVNLGTGIASTPVGLKFLAFSGGYAAGLTTNTTTGEVQNFATTNYFQTWYANNSEQMRLTSTGLGIGTSSPAAKLHVAGDGRFTGTFPALTLLRTDSTSPASRIRMAGSDNADKWEIATNYLVGGAGLEFNYAGSNLAFLSNSGNLGLGVTPSAWDATGAGGPVLQIKRGLLFGADTETRLIHNAYYGTGDFRYIATGVAATNYQQQSGQHRWYTAPSGTAGNTFSFTQALTLDASGNLLLGGTTAGASSAASLAIFNGTAPTGSVTNGIILYAEDVSSSSELKVRDEAGNVTTLSPHNFSLIPDGPSEDMAWAYYSEKGGKRINVDMLKLARMVEKLTGEKLVYES